MIKTMDELKEEWGQIRFVEALAFLSGWYIENGVPCSQEEIKSLLDANLDAFDVFGARMLEKSDTVSKS